MKKRFSRAFIMLALFAALTGCGIRQEKNVSAETASEEVTAAKTTAAVKAGDSVQEEAVQTEGQSAVEEPAAEEGKENMLRMMIGDTAVAVEWEQNEAVEALKALCEKEPLVIQMSMYGGFEQVGPIGTRLPSHDAQTTTSAGDIVLYSSNQIVVFYGSNSWAYTRLGHITDQDASGMAGLLGDGDVTITIRMEDAG